MEKFVQVGVLLVALFGVLASCQNDLVLAVLDNPSLLRNRLNDGPLVRRTVACVLDQQPCDNFGNLMKSASQEILGNGCGRCTPQQRVNAEGLKATFAQKYPREWAAVIAKYQYRRG